MATKNNAMTVIINHSSGNKFFEFQVPRQELLRKQFINKIWEIIAERYTTPASMATPIRERDFTQAIAQTIAARVMSGVNSTEHMSQTTFLGVFVTCSLSRNDMAEVLTGIYHAQDADTLNIVLSKDYSNTHLATILEDADDVVREIADKARSLTANEQDNSDRYAVQLSSANQSVQPSSAAAPQTPPRPSKSNSQDGSFGGKKSRKRRKKRKKRKRKRKRRSKKTKRKSKKTKKTKRRRKRR